VIFGFPTGRNLGTLRANDNGDILSEAKLDVFGAFVNDTWSMRRLTGSAPPCVSRHSVVPRCAVAAVEVPAAIRIPG
jgi:hypothetical protein